MTVQSVLIAGGYCVVGRRFAAHLARDSRVLVAGRHQEQANIVAAAIGHHAVGREIDVTSGRLIAAALDGVSCGQLGAVRGPDAHILVVVSNLF